MEFYQDSIKSEDKILCPTPETRPAPWILEALTAQTQKHTGQNIYRVRLLF
jgi:hypothetical protein